MSRRTAILAVILCTFTVTTYFAGGLVRKPQVEPMASVSIPAPIPGDPRLPTVPAEVVNFPLDDDGNLRVTEQGGPREVIVTNPTLHVTASPRQLVQGHSALSGQSAVTLVVPAGVVLTDISVTTSSGYGLAAVHDDAGPYLNGLNSFGGGKSVSLASGIVSDGTLTVTGQCDGNPCIGAFMWSGYIP